jgi:hypothetical protein
VFASFTLAFALQLRKKHGKTSIRVRKTSVRLRKTSVTVQYIVSCIADTICAAVMVAFFINNSDLQFLCCPLPLSLIYPDVL